MLFEMQIQLCSKNVNSVKPVNERSIVGDLFPRLTPEIKKNPHRRTLECLLRVNIFAEKLVIFF